MTERFFVGFQNWTATLRDRPARMFDAVSARVFVCTAEGTDTVLGFYTLSALAIDLSPLPEELSRKLPRHPVPCALIGRLAIDQSVRRHGLGRMLLVDAIKRTMRASDIMAIYAVIVDAKNNAAKQFYEGFGFASMQDDSMRLFYRLARSIFKILLQTRHWDLAGQIEFGEKFFNEIIRHPAPT